MSILVVGGAPQDLELMKTILSAVPGWNVVTAQSGAEALRALARGRVDLVLADLMAPGLDGLDLCRHIGNCSGLGHIPLVVLLAAAERGYLGQVYEAGACDYIMKPMDPVEVVARVRSVLRTKEEVNRRKAHENQLETRNRELQAVNHELLQLSLIDAVTGVANRRHFDEMMDRAWRSAARHQFEIALIVMDIDFFKGYNDRWGHPAGDDCLRRVATELAAGLLRPDDFLGRYGGEEFAVILPRNRSAWRRVRRRPSSLQRRISWHSASGIPSRRICNHQPGFSVRGPHAGIRALFPNCLGGRSTL